MIVPREFYNGPAPERRPRVSNNPTLLYSWWCTLFAAVIIGARICGRYVRNEKLFKEDKFMAWSLIPLFVRMAFVHVVVNHGTNNVDLQGLTDPEEIHRRRTGSQMVLGARIFYALFIWMAKYTVTEFLKRLIERFWKRTYERDLKAIRFFLVVTFVMVFISTLAECQHITHYWQVIPDPGPRCRQGYAQLLTMGITDIVTDVLIIAFPIPIIIRSSMHVRRKLPLIALFSMSLVLVVVTAARMPAVIHRKGLQQFRTVFASSEILVAAIVANAIILGSFLRDRGLKKQRFRAPSAEGGVEREPSGRGRYANMRCASDENLARSMSFLTKPELMEQPSFLPRPAPIVDLKRPLECCMLPGTPLPSTWRPPEEDFEIRRINSDSSQKKSPLRRSVSSAHHGRRVSWMDLGGLLENSIVCPSPPDSVIAQDFATQAPRSARAPISHGPDRSSLSAPRTSPRLSQQSLDSVVPSFSAQNSAHGSLEDVQQETHQAMVSPTSDLPTIQPESSESTRLDSQSASDSPSSHEADSPPRPTFTPIQNYSIGSEEILSPVDAGCSLSSPSAH